MIERPDAVPPFDWEVMASGTSHYWSLAWALLREQEARLAEDGITAVDRTDAGTGSPWTPIVDLALGEPTHRPMVDGGFTPGREVQSLADGRAPRRLAAGTRLGLLAAIPDRYYEGLGTNFWKLDENTDLDVPYIHSALEGRWGGAAVLADRLIVRTDHPLLGDASRADRLVADLRTITRDFRRTNGLPADGNLASQ